MTAEEREEIREILYDFLEETGSAVGSERVIDLTEDQLTDEELEALVIPAVKPGRSLWVQTTLRTMMRPITRNISDLNTIKVQAVQAIDAANAAATGANNVDLSVTGLRVTITDRTGVSRTVDIGFDFYNSYPSVAAMNADKDSIPLGKLVSIATNDKTAEENARVYQKRSDGQMIYLFDLDQASASAWADWLENMKPMIQQAIRDAVDAAISANHNASLAEEKAALANEKAGLANQAANNANSQATYAKNQGDYAKNMADHPSYIGSDGYWYHWDYASQCFVKGAKAKGEDIDYSTMTASEKSELAQLVADKVAMEGGYALIPVNESTLTTTTVFLFNSIICINGVVYKANKQTQTLPFPVVIQGNKFVTQTKYGKTCLVLSSNVKSADWDVWIDASNDVRFKTLEERVARLEAIVNSL